MLERLKEKLLEAEEKYGHISPLERRIGYSDALSDFLTELNILEDGLIEFMEEHCSYTDVKQIKDYLYEREPSITGEIE